MGEGRRLHRRCLPADRGGDDLGARPGRDPVGLHLRRGARWDGRFFRLDAHLDRFAESLARLRLDPGLDRDGVEDVLHGCVRRAGLRDAYVSMTCTRGRIAPGSRDLRTARHTFYCYAVPFVWIATPQQQAAGVGIWISDVHRIPPESVDPAVKNYHWLDMDLALLEAYEHDAQLVVLRIRPAGSPRGRGSTSSPTSAAAG